VCPAEVRTERANPVVRSARGLIDAIAFLTVVPLPAFLFASRFGSGSALADRFELGPALPWFPVVGAAVGAVGGGIRVGFESLLGAGPSTALAMAAMVAVTGALHQDALADTFDGLGVRGDRARRLAVMRDSTVGAFGVLGVVLWALVEFTALDGLSADHALLALIAAGAVSRMVAPLHGRLAPPARADGLGVALGAGWARCLAAVVVAAVVSVLALGVARAGLGVGVGLAVAGLSAVAARRAVGGSTGDTLGASVAVGEAVVCLALLASWR
jgi:adenosylcobinamide-GDP ribazoletransferase